MKNGDGVEEREGGKVGVEWGEIGIVGEEGLWK